MDESQFNQGEFSLVDALSKAKSTGMSGMIVAGILKSGKRNVRLRKSSRLDSGITVSCPAWETVNQINRVLEARGEGTVAELARNHATCARRWSTEGEGWRTI